MVSEGLPVVSLPVQEQTKDAAVENRGAQRVRTICWAVALLVGVLDAWTARHSMNPDGIAYLDIGDAYWRGDWRLAVNSYWSPLYSWILGLALRLLRPSPGWEFPAVHLVNFLIFAASLWSFDFFWRAAFDECQRQGPEAPNKGLITWPEWAWWTLGYTLFLWSSTSLIGIGTVTPDLCVAALVYLASGLLLRIRKGNTGWSVFVAFSMVLGFAYLAKAAMFPLALVFFGVCFLSVHGLGRSAARVLLAFVVFAAVVSPFMRALSLAKGRLTFGDAGALNYAWNMTPRLAEGYWVGDVPGSGVPRHGVRKIFDVPAVYEFGTPIRATYPLWYDPSYWHEGVRLRFDLKQQFRMLLKSSASYYGLFVHLQGGLVAGVLILLGMSPRGWSSLKEMAKSWPLLIPAAAAMGMYSLVTVQSRYVAPFILLFWAGVLARARFADSRESRRLMAGVVMVAAITLLKPLPPSLFFSLTTRQDEPHQAIMAGLRKLGIRPGDKVAFIGLSGFAYWARLSRVSIVADIPPEDAVSFWAADASVKMKVIRALARTGAKVIVAKTVPRSILTSETPWKQIGQTDHYVYVLSIPHDQTQTSSSSGE